MDNSLRLCECQSCDWTGPEADLKPIEEQGIFDRVAPGEVMPAGECPKCGAVAHLTKPDDDSLAALIGDALLYEAGQFDGPEDEDLEVSGADLVDWFTDWRERAKRALRRGQPAKPVAKARLAVLKLRRARELLKAAGATRAVDRVRLAITSAEGAVRNAENKGSRAHG